MKVIFSYNIPFYLAHGGQQTLIESLMHEMAALGVDVQPERWWDAQQTGDILQFIGRPNGDNARLAKLKGMKVVMMENLDVLASQSKGHIMMKEWTTKLARKVLPGLDSRLRFYDEVDALVYVVPHEWKVVQQIYGVAPEKGTIIAHGLLPDALDKLTASQPEGDYLVSVGTICERKNSVLLARCAKKAKVPVVFMGRPFSRTDPYFQEFAALIDDEYVRFTDYISEPEKYDILRGARGFVLLSRGESGCISVYEASAAGLPLLLPDLPWVINGYPVSDRLVKVPLHAEATIVKTLSEFYAMAHRQTNMTFPVGTWKEVALSYVRLYEKLLTQPAVEI